MAIRPDHITLTAGATPPPADNLLRGHIIQRDFLGPHFEYLVAVGALVLRVKSERDLALGDAWGTRGADDYREIQSQLMLVAMIESEKGVRAIPGLAAVEGLDMLFIGPLDLSASAGMMGLLNDPAFTVLLREAEMATVANGLLLGGAAVPGDTAATCFQRGYRLLTVGNDVSMLTSAAADSLRQDG